MNAVSFPSQAPADTLSPPSHSESNAVDLIGRRPQLDRIASIAEFPREGALLFVGEHGSGKSRLLEVAHAQSKIPAVVLHTNPLEAAWPLSGFTSLLAYVDDSRETELASQFELRSSRPDDMFAAVHELLSRVRSLGLPRILVLVDDVDRMDAESQGLIGLMPGRLIGTGLCLVATATRIGKGGPLGGFPVASVDRLDFEESLLVATALAREGSEGAMRIVAAESAGSPLALHETMRALSPGQIAGIEPMVLPLQRGDWAQTAVEHRLDCLSDTQLRMLEQLALAPLSHARAVTLGEDDASDDLNDLIANGFVVSRGQHVHVADSAVRSHFFWRTNSRSRRELHRELADASAGIEPRLAAWHESFASPDDSAATALVASAVRFAGEGNMPVAIEFAERALVVSRGSDDNIALVVELAAAFWKRGELAHAARYVMQARHESAAPSLVLKLAALKIAIDHARTHRLPENDVDVWVGMYSDEDPDGATRLLSVAAALHSARWETDAARELLAQAEPLLSLCSTPTQALHRGVRSVVDALDGNLSRFVDPLANLRGAALAHLPTPELMLLGQSLSFAERYRDARRIYAVIANRQPALDPIWSEATRFLIVDNEIRSGRFQEAQNVIEDWHPTLSQWHAYRASRTLVRAWRLYLADRLDEAQYLLAECLEQASHERDHSVAANVLALQGNVALMTGDNDDAVRLLELAETLGGHLKNPAILRHAADRVEALVMTGRMREASAAWQSLQARSRDHSSRWTELALARMRALVAGDEPSVLLFQEALDLFEPADSPYEFGRTWACLAYRLERLGRHGESEAAFASARSAFEIAGATSWSHQMERKDVLDDNEGHALLTLLSEEERLVAHKVRQGYRNKEIAEALYVSLRTVELRLTHIYRKVGARSRSHLVALMT